MASYCRYTNLKHMATATDNIHKDIAIELHIDGNYAQVTAQIIEFCILKHYSLVKAV